MPMQFVPRTASAGPVMGRLVGLIRPYSSVTRRFQVMSDLHLEISEQYTSFEFPATAPFLILAGDIGRLRDYDEYVAFLRRQTARYRRVFLVLGNHELYGMGYRSALERAQQMVLEPCLERKTTLLHRHRYDMPDESGISILGCTLWSRVPQESSSAVSRALNDFRQIQQWSVDDHNDAHSADISWLRQQVRDIQQDKEDPPRSVIVVTHHAPMIAGSAHPRFDETPVQTAFATDICTTGDWGPVRHWVFGHTHWTTDLLVNGIRVIGNQRDYVYPSNVRVRARTLPPEHTFDATTTIEV